MTLSKSDSIRDVIGQNTIMSWGLSSVSIRVTFPWFLNRSNMVCSQFNVLPLTIDWKLTVGSSEKWTGNENSTKLNRRLFLDRSQLWGVICSFFVRHSIVCCVCNQSQGRENLRLMVVLFMANICLCVCNILLSTCFQSFSSVL